MRVEAGHAGAMCVLARPTLLLDTEGPMTGFFRFSLAGSFVLALTISSCGGEEPNADDGASGGQGGEPSLGSGGESDTGGTGGTGGTGPVKPTGPPELLSETGLFEDDMETLAARVRAYEPRFVLWSDNAEKRRWISLPEGEQIDTTEPDYWRMPAGTKLWKEFTRDGVRVETRLLHKQTDGSWWRVSYHWNDEQTDATAVPEGLQNASGTDHDIPSVEDCSTCHGNTTGTVLGFSAVQLAHDDSEYNLDDLTTEGVLSAPVIVQPVPGTADQQAILGYFHVNCGTCHNPTSSVQARVDMDLRLRFDSSTDVTETPLYVTAVGIEVAVTDGDVPAATLRIDPGFPETSAVYLRLHSRGQGYSMPPVGSEDIDEAPAAAIAVWIESL